MIATEPRGNGTVDTAPTSRPIDRCSAVTVVVSRLDRTTQARSIAVAPWEAATSKGGGE